MPLEPIRIKPTPKFMERWSSAEENCQRLLQALWVLLAALVIACMVMVFLSSQQKPVYVLSSTGAVGWANPVKENTDIAAMFAQGWLLGWLNYTPATVETVVNYHRQLMSAGMLARTRAKVQDDIDASKNNNVSVVFMMDGQPNIVKTDKGYTLRISGYKSVYVASEMMSSQNIVYQVEVVKAPTTPVNPIGLMIDDIREENNG